MMMKCCSFDIFDTILTRTVLYPRDVFHLVQGALANSVPAVPGRLARSFWGGRVWAEFIARRQRNSEDISLTDIYRVIARRHVLDDRQRNGLMQLELAMESLVLVPVPGAAQLVDNWRSQVDRVVFASDMYLPTVFLREILERHGLFADGDRIYVSGELGKTKASGQLFWLMLEDLGITPGEMVHIGDNHLADCLIPQSLGINGPESPRNTGRWKLMTDLKLKVNYLRQLLVALLQMSGVRNV